LERTEKYLDKIVEELNRKIHEKLQGTDIVYLDVFNRLLQDGRLNPELTLDDLHLNGKGYSILTEALKQASGL
jgi:lysophospholipase L1-like esterase